MTLLGVLLSTSEAADLIRSRAVFEDPGGTLAIEQVVDQQFDRLNGMLSRGYTDSAFWIRLEINPAEDGGPIRLRIVPTLLDDVRLYEPAPDAPQGWIVHASGDNLAFETSNRNVQSLGFMLQPKKPWSTYYLRVQTTASMLVNTEAVHPGWSNRMDGNLVLFQLAYLSFMVSIMAWALKSYWQQHDRLTAFFIAHHFFNLLLSFAFLGFLGLLEPRDSAGLNNALTALILCLDGIFAVLFHREVFALFVPKRALMMALNQLTVVFAACLVVFFAGWQRQALYANALALLAFGVLLLLLALTARKKGLLSLRVLRSAYLLLSLSLTAALLPTLGWIGGDRLVLIGIPVYGFISAGVMVYLLAHRGRIMAAQANEKLRQGELAMQQLELEKRYANEQERFFDMLTHELKTPISVALMSLGALKSDSPYLTRIRRALGNINDIVDRTRLVELHGKSVCRPI